LLLQCLQNDLKKGTCPAHQLVCLVVDECHMATFGS
jgi:ERCC4-related helicase